MILDSKNLFSDSQAVTATADSTNVIDLDLAGRNLGIGKEFYVFVSLSVAMTDSGSDSTVTVTLVTDDNAALSSATTLHTFPVFAAVSAAGTQRFAHIPISSSYEQFLGLIYTLANGNLTTGSFDAGILMDVDQFTSYAQSTGAQITA